MAIDFPNSPTNGQTFSVGDRTWTFNGTVWKQTGSTGITGPTGPQGPTGAAGATGPTSQIAFFGSGSDGNLIASSGTTTLVRDMYYNNITLTGTAAIITSGFKIFVAGTLDLTGAQVAAIRWNGNAGGSATSATGATAGAASATATQLPGWQIGIAGANGTTTVGVTAGSPGNNYFWGGDSVIGNGGCIGGTGASGAGGSRPTPTGPFLNAGSPQSPMETSGRWYLWAGNTVYSGNRGYGGSGGGGDGTNAGGGGGASGTGGGCVFIAANIINRSGAGNPNVIQALGGAGGNGYTPTVGNVGGGAGGSGGGGGIVVIAYETLLGTTQTNLIQVDGGAGGTGGNGVGTGTAGTGGVGGQSGIVTLMDMTAGTSTSTAVVNPANQTVSGTAGTVGGIRQVSL